MKYEGRTTKYEGRKANGQRRSSLFVLRSSSFALRPSLFVLFLAGCSGGPPAPAGTGAEGVVRSYYDALVRKDWPDAYTALHPDSRAKLSAAQFTQHAEGYRRKLGFEPQEVAVRSCEEHGTEALAHVVLKGQTAGGARSYKDAVVLRQTGSSWGVVLPAR